MPEIRRRLKCCAHGQHIGFHASTLPSIDIVLSVGIVPTNAPKQAARVLWQIPEQAVRMFAGIASGTTTAENPIASVPQL